jgi:proline iminopeptidase
MLRFILFLMMSGVSMTSALHARQGDTLFPDIQPYEQGYLRVSDVHEIYYEYCGNPEGLPVFVLHGGPGGNISPYYRRFCDPSVYRIVLFDQRGCGKSRPKNELRENTTWDLVGDVEKLRVAAGAERIILFGGSWGTTLALAYAEKYPQHVAGMVLRGVFLGTDGEIDWFYHGGLAKIFPDGYAELLSVLPDPSRRPLPAYLFELIRDADPEARDRYVDAWTLYESRASKVDADGSYLQRLRTWLDGNTALSFALFENYYMANRCFLEPDQLLDHADTIRDIPVIMVNGRFDVICPPGNAWKLKSRLANAKLVLVGDAGHSMSEPGNERAQVQAFREFEVIARGGTWQATE